VAERFKGDFMSFIINPGDIVDFKTYRCNKDMADYLIYEMGLPVLSISKDNGNQKPYYFAITDELLAALYSIKNKPEGR